MDAFLSQWTSCSSLLAEEEVGVYLTRFEVHTSCLGFLITQMWVLRKIRATHLLSGVSDNTGVSTSQDSSYTPSVWRFLTTQVCTSQDSSYPVTGSLFHCQWPPNFIGKAFFSRKSGSLFHEKLVPNIIDKNTLT